MTSQTKKFIDPSDIIGLRLECSHSDCKATLLLPISKELHVDKFYTCPYCERPWIKLPTGAGADLSIKKCVEQLKELNDLLMSGQYKGFSLTLEVKEEPKQSISQT